MEPRDSAHLSGTWTATSLAGTCGPVTLTMSADVNFRLAEGALETQATHDADADAAIVGCNVVAISPTEDAYECVLPTGGSINSLVTRFFTRRDGFFASPELTAVADILVANVGCVVDRDRYRCVLPFFNDDPWCDPAIDADCPCAGPSDPSCYLAGDPYEPVLDIPAPFDYSDEFPRPRDLIAGTRDLVLDLPNGVELDVSDVCLIEPLVRERLRREVAGNIHLLTNGLAGALSSLLGDSFTADYGIPIASLRACGANPDGSPNDSACHTREFLGSRRHGCAQIGTSYVCDVVRIEPRRLNFRPDGIEVVLAEGPEDPQAFLFSGRSDPLDPSMSPTQLCGVGRYSRTGFGAGAGFTETELEAGMSTDILFDGGGFCSTSATNCAGICPQAGTRCGSPAIGIAGLSDIPAGTLRCELGECCVGTECASGPAF